MNATFIEVRYVDGSIDRAEGEAAKQIWEWLSGAQAMYCERGGRYRGLQFTNIPGPESAAPAEDKK